MQSQMTEGATPFEGPEKLLEIWFASCPQTIKNYSQVENEKLGLRGVPQNVWQEMLDIVKCQILSTVRGQEIDAYLLSESSLFVWPHKIILKTCGRTLNLLGLPRILEIAANHAGLSEVYQFFYSRKSFMFPEQQLGPHKDWADEVQFLDDIFKSKGGGNAYTIGKVNGDHWLLYLTGIPDVDSENQDRALPSLDYTVEILMSDLAGTAREPFFFSKPAVVEGPPSAVPEGYAFNLSTATGIASLFPPHVTTLDAYVFDPCGYSANALIQWDEHPASPRLMHYPPPKGEGYYTIHVTPEEGYSYASFECNVALPSSPSGDHGKAAASRIPDLQTLIQRVVQIFQPGRLTLTVFMSASSYHDARGDSEIEAAQKAFLSALQTVQIGPALKNVRYKRTDKINYEFGNYDLAFATFEAREKL